MHAQHATHAQNNARTSCVHKLVITLAPNHTHALMKFDTNTVRNPARTRTRTGKTDEAVDVLRPTINLDEEEEE